MKRILVACWIISLLLLDYTYAQNPAQLKMTLKVMDETESPVEQALVRGGIWSPDVPFNEIESGKYKDLRIEGKTDTNGLFVIEKKVWHDLGWSVTKDGFYRTGGKYNAYKKGQSSIVDGRWQPWNPTVAVVLKRIKNPIPMYARKVEKKFPVLEKPVAYDLMQADWVQPYGKGIVTDFLFVVSADFKERSDRHVTLNVSCPSDGNGIIETKVPAGESGPIGSTFWSLHEAPSNKYTKTWEYRLIASTNSQERIFPQEKEKGLILYYRIRSVFDQDKIQSALYGKIYGHISADFDELRQNHERHVEIYFTYYLNPTPNDRNMEFDPKKNLLKGLKSTEEVTAP